MVRYLMVRYWGISLEDYLTVLRWKYCSLKFQVYT